MIDLLKASDGFLKEPNSESRRRFFDNLESVKRFERDQSDQARRPVRLWVGIAALLMLAFFAGLIAISSLVISTRATQAAHQQTAGAVYSTNTAVAVALNSTNTANAWTSVRRDKVLSQFSFSRSVTSTSR